MKKEDGQDEREDGKKKRMNDGSDKEKMKKK